MKRNRSLPVVVLLILMGFPTAVHAQSLAASLRAGTEGIGFGLTAPIAPTLNGRVQGSFFSYSQSGTTVVDDVDVAYDAKGELFLLAALTDWHPFGNAFRLSGGVYYNGIKGSGLLNAAEPVEVSNRTYDPSEIGDLDIDVSPGTQIAPYFGVGFGNALKRSFGFSIDVGALYHGAPSVEMTGTRMLEPMHQEAAQVEENISWARFYPVLTIGFSTRLF
jgi:hypothetical protein